MKFRFQTSLLLSALIWWPATAAEPPGNTSPPLYRYLLVVDTSASMAQQKDAAADALGKLITSGINGRIQTGDLLGVWTIGEKLNQAAYGPKMWNDAERADIAGRVLAVARDAKSSKPANLGLVIAAINPVAKASGSLTVFLVTDGVTPVQGTPFDDAINEVFRGHSAAMKKAKSPFVLVLNAQDGELVSQAISPGGAKIYIPSALKSPTDAAIEQDLFGIKRPETNSVAPAAETVKTNAPKTLSVAEISEILLKQQATRTNVPTQVAAAGGTTNSPGAVTNAEPKPVATEITPPVAVAVPKTPADAPTSAPPPPPAESVKTPDSAITVAAAPSNMVTNAIESVPKSAVEEPPAAAPAAQESVGVLTVTPSEMSRRYLMMAGGLFLVAMLLGWLLVRWRRPRSYPSLITRSLRERERR